jgi:ssDNA-binding replication factor A large subunit
MTVDELVEQLSEEVGLSRETILEKLKREKHRTGGLISDVALLQIIAAELGVQIQGNKTSEPTLMISDLVPNLSNVTVVGRIVAVFPPRTFNGNRSGRFASLLVADKSSIVRVVFWNDKVSFLESGGMKVGQVVRFSHGYTKEDRSGKVEVHIGERSEITVESENVQAKEYPTISNFTAKIAETVASCQNGRVNLAGTVRNLSTASMFIRQDSTCGKVLRLRLADETGEVFVVVWNEKVDALEKSLRKGMRLQLVSAKVKKSACGGLEVHVDGGTYVEAFPPKVEFSAVADLKGGLSEVNVRGEVATKPLVREVRTSRGELVKLAVFELKDETGTIWVSAWRKHAEIVDGLHVGDRIVVKNALAKKGFSDGLEISTRDATSIVSLSEGNLDE